MSYLIALKASFVASAPADATNVIGRVESLKTGAFWNRLGTRFLPFADAATKDLPLSRILRLSLFQISVGMAAVLLQGTLNRVMIVELGMSASLVAAMVSLPLLFAPLRALIGFKSDHHTSLLGWKRVPYIWFGTLMQFGGLAILPFALLVMTGGGTGPAFVGQFGAVFGFLLVGAGMHMTQTAGLALATDLAPEHARPRVVALLYVMLLIGMLVSSIVIGRLLVDFTPTKLVQIVQGVAALTMVLNIVALWKQEARNRTATARRATPIFREVWAAFIARPRTIRLLVAVGLGAAAFSTHDVLLEPYGGQVLGLGVGATTLLTAAWAAGMLVGFALAARRLADHGEPLRLAGFGATIGIVAFLAVIFAGPLGSPAMLGIGATAIGLGNGLFSVGTLIAAMAITDDASLDGRTGLALGAWGAVQASAAGAAIGIGVFIRDIVSTAAVAHNLGPTLAGPDAGYAVVYILEIVLLIGTLVALGPLVQSSRADVISSNTRFSFQEFPI
ncbi:BCD family chlorophyll transporter-like MFS transporter [Sphingomonas vulcanisoli]|uniref:BCD family chlorophyll transporter-like MFS transporter n=1 Tax=Sphingomonas vulcanisoli TaxID=1658060 RepID=A0ABX0TVF5_9SPHN|nr:BCD family MFS transporter [Sphingomonas vulcanisoli]NIJ08435.1 BCD family chlorophyll transporter-like MFS transporter [Sphingomonas vulcanisoli]